MKCYDKVKELREDAFYEFYLIYAVKPYWFQKKEFI